MRNKIEIFKRDVQEEIVTDYRNDENLKGYFLEYKQSRDQDYRISISESFRRIK
jgi:hypothetical protein